MKQTIFILLFSSVCFSILADRREVVLSPGSPQHNHLEHYPIADMPDAVYYDDVAHEIIIEADGTSLYYNVEIVSDSLNQTVILTQVDGNGDTIDVSSLPVGSYTIVITSQFLNEYEGQFTI